jgi:capsular exopolysaccharide synthesis family protein
VGLVLGLGAMFLQEHLDTSMRTSGDVDTYLGVPTLAAIPAIDRRRGALPYGATASLRWGRGRAEPESRHESPLAEAFAALRAKVMLNESNSARVLLITSARASEGKTCVSINLALSLARLQHRVLLVDGNMRDPGVERALKLDAGPGLVGYLTNDADWRTFVRQQAHPNLDVLIGGTAAISPADLLSLPRMRQLVADASRAYDFVLIDSPALLPHPADVHSLATLVDSVLLTVRQGVTPREEVSLALSQLPRVSGVVLNRSDGRDIVLSEDDVVAASA